MYGKIERKEVLNFLKDSEYKQNAETYFGKHQPSIYKTGWYSTDSWNWAYEIGLTSYHRTGQDAKDFGKVQWFEVITQFGSVVAARKINLDWAK